VRVGERLREEIALLIQDEVRDPRVVGVAVTEVSMTPDLQLARVRVRLTVVAPADEAKRRKALLAGLESASGMLRRELGHRLGLRYAPKLAFHYDESPEAKDRIDRLLDEIAREPKARE
jgi:ribosome-binding factor A